MPTRPILIRVAFAFVLMAALVALADGVARQELQRAMGDTAALPLPAGVQTTGAIR